MMGLTPILTNFYHNFRRFPPWGSKGNAVRGNLPNAAAAPATVSGEFFVKCHWESRPGKATKGNDPRARRPAVSRGHTRRCRSGSTDISFTRGCVKHDGETWFAVTCH